VENFKKRVNPEDVDLEGSKMLLPICDKQVVSNELDLTASA
jgi:hypothetical protein